MKDNRGTEIEIGQTVVYNFSGEIAIGKLEKITERKRYGYTYNEFHIRRQSPKGSWTKDVSKVTRPENLMVIFEDLCLCGAVALGVHPKTHV